MNIFLIIFFFLASSTLEQQYGHLSHVEVNEMLGLMGNIGSKVPSYNTMPCWVVLFVEFLLDESLIIFKK